MKRRNFLGGLIMLPVALKAAVQKKEPENMPVVQTGYVDTMGDWTIPADQPCPPGCVCSPETDQCVPAEPEYEYEHEYDYQVKVRWREVELTDKDIVQITRAKASYLGYKADQVRWRLRPRTFNK